MLSDDTVGKHTIEKNDGKKHRCLKHFYKFYVCEHCRHLFHKLLSYNRFVELERRPRSR